MSILLPLLGSTSAKSIGDTACKVGSDAIGCGDKGLLASGGFVTNAINTVLIIIGAISVIMIIIGGLRYVLSGGDSAGIKGAKDTIIYALVGLVVSLLAYTIVSFITGKVG